MGKKKGEKRQMGTFVQDLLNCRALSLVYVLFLQEFILFYLTDFIEGKPYQFTHAMPF
jgi:hypothetical protein